MKMALAALLVMLGISTVAYGGDENTLNELASNSSMCAAYYLVVEECIKGEKHIDAKKKFAGLADEMIMASLVFSNQKTAQARLNLYKKQLYAEVENNCGNLARAIEKYSDDCLLLSKAFRDKE